MPRISTVWWSTALTSCLLILICLTSTSKAQITPSFGFIHDLNTPLFLFNESATARNPWAGGLNAPQFSEIHLNGDTLPDLLVFDRSGDVLLTFLKSNQDYAYQYAPQYESRFPKCQDWVLLRDFDQDGLEDLFCSAGNGIQVYKNIGELGDPSFELFQDLLLSDYGGGVFNLFVSPVDIPAINDVDGDGDLDILTFYILGTCVEYHRNLSVELSGAANQLVFRLESSNWGNFTEDAQSNQVNYNDSCGRSADRHSGSTLLLHDIDLDGDGDLILGDISYAEALVLINEPENGLDHMQALPINYPSYNEFNIEVFPAAFTIHANNDGIEDLIIAPNTEVQSQNKGRICQSFASSGAQFRFNSAPQAFLSHEMVDFGRSAYPSFVDIDLDGDLDIVAGSFGEFIPSGTPGIEGLYVGSLSLLLNEGSISNPSYRVTNQDFANLKSLNLRHIAPTFGDLNQDNFPDLVFGTLSQGLMLAYYNPTSQAYDLPSSLNLNGIPDYSSPCLFDLDADGLLDILVGGKSGKLRFYKNTGTPANPSFTYIPSEFDNQETIQEGLSNFGYSSPSIYSYNDSLHILSGSESGRLFYWKARAITNNFIIELVDSNFQNLTSGIWTSPSLGNISGDDRPELILGNRRGGLNLFRGDVPQQLSELSKIDDFVIYPNPSPNGQGRIKSYTLSYPIEITVSDLAGRIVLHHYLQSDEAIELGEPGMYLLTVTDKKGYRTTKRWLIE